MAKRPTTQERIAKNYAAARAELRKFFQLSVNDALLVAREHGVDMARLSEDIGHSDKLDLYVYQYLPGSGREYVHNQDQRLRVKWQAAAYLAERYYKGEDGVNRYPTWFERGIDRKKLNETERLTESAVISLVEMYRELVGVTNESVVIGPEPQEPDQIVAWRFVRAILPGVFNEFAFSHQGANAAVKTKARQPQGTAANQPSDPFEHGYVSVGLGRKSSGAVERRPIVQMSALAAAHGRTDSTDAGTLGRVVEIDFSSPI